ncbi:hypothetical protein L798_14212 [Zootermopsis nevadensis]|uniref:Uncharacterized protein n=1 Tax=Zootermopsis nevadensis TaxID=136037 RepID=A0A067RH26_ZOONE|nr:hypothetical protein L798_14212 [Zootermopsis nevadensis]
MEKKSASCFSHIIHKEIKWEGQCCHISCFFTLRRRVYSQREASFISCTRHFKSSLLYLLDSCCTILAT